VAGVQTGTSAVLLKPPMFPSMLPDVTVPVPASLMTLLAVFSQVFAAPSFETFCGLACGFLAQTGKRTVCGMLTGRACRGCGRTTGCTISSPRPLEPR